jgi:hypothetical protein
VFITGGLKSPQSPLDDAEIGESDSDFRVIETIVNLFDR